MTKITTKGQMTIPKRLRDHLGLKPGSSVEFELADAYFLQPRQQTPQTPQRKFGRLCDARYAMTTDEVMALARGEDND